MSRIIEVESDVASKIQARARERGFSVNVYLRELIDEKRTASEKSNGLSPQQRVRMCENGPRATAATPEVEIAFRISPGGVN